MSESNLQMAKVGDLVLVHHDNGSSDKRSQRIQQAKRPCDLILIWAFDDVAATARAISLTDLLPRRRQRESLNVYSDPEEFCHLLKEVVVDPLFRLSRFFKPLAKPLDELVGERDYVLLRPSFHAVRKVWLEDGCC